MLILAAGEMVQVAGEETATDAASVTAAFKKYLAAVKAMNARAAQEQDVPSAFSGLADAARDFEIASRERAAVISSKKTFNTGERLLIRNHSGWMVEGQPRASHPGV